MGQWVDFRRIKEVASLAEVIRRYGVELRASGPQCLRGRCPLPSHSSRDSADSFSINTAKNIWACHSQSCVAKRGAVGGNVLDFVAVMEGCTIRDAALLLLRSFSAPSEIVPSQAMDGSRGARQGPGNRSLGFRLFGIEPSHAYIAKRGITLATARHFGIGYYSGRGMMSNRVVIPIHNRSGDLVAYAGRSIDGAPPKYRLPPGFRKTEELFNLHRAASITTQGRAILVEGFFDCMKVHQAGYANVIAAMGCSLSEIQAGLLADHFHEIVLLLDGDLAGLVASEKIAARLSGSFRISRGRIPRDRQPDQLTSSELRAVIEAALS